ncbi:quinone oxidoreductase family protein [Streptomyces mexicanus]|uniref:quinone oxidoreductase family protein n=1 Tax=Streptomyces mexicanus TaxID=178566 RepID=UPI0036B70E28
MRVAALSEDAFADHVVADAAWPAAVPEGLDAGAAGMLPLGGPVALGVLRAARPAPGETVLVHAAAGGIGHLAVQLAKLLGAGTVIATVGSAAKLDFVREHDADVAVGHSAEDRPARVREAAPDGVDVVLDSAGGTVLRQSVDLLAPLGRVVLYGVASSDVDGVPVTGLFALTSLIGFSLPAWRAADPERARPDIAEVTVHLAAGRLRAAVRAALPLTEAAEAHRLLEARSNLGRVLLPP